MSSDCRGRGARCADVSTSFQYRLLKSAKLLPKGVLKVLPGLPHGMCTSHAETVNAELLAFFRS